MSNKPGNNTRIIAGSVLKLRQKAQDNRESIQKQIKDVQLRRYLFKNRQTLLSKENPSSDQFFGTGIKLFMLRTTEGRYFNSMSLIKLFIFEPIFINFQLFPTT